MKKLKAFTSWHVDHFCLKQYVFDFQNTITRFLDFVEAVICFLTHLLIFLHIDKDVSQLISH